MSGTAQAPLHVIAAVIIYRERGVTRALAYLEENGYSRTEALDMLEVVDNMVEAVKAGKLD